MTEPLTLEVMREHLFARLRECGWDESVAAWMSERLLVVMLKRGIIEWWGMTDSHEPLFVPHEYVDAVYLVAESKEE